MEYADFKANGYYIGSGRVEAAPELERYFVVAGWE